jgi:putative transposase
VDPKKLVTAQQRREWARYFVEHGMSIARCCALIGMRRSTFYYKGHGAEDEELVGKLQEIAGEHKRYGYRRAWALLRRRGEWVNVKRVHRLWKETGLGLPRKRFRKRLRKGAGTPLKALHPNHVWTYDFMEDATIDGRKLRVLTVVDEFTRESPTIAVDRRMPASQVIEVLKRAFAERGAPRYLRSDNGPEFIAEAVKKWLASRGTKPYYIDPGCPWQNPYGESFNDKLRGECLNMELFASLPEARIVIEEWRRNYNGERPHSSLGYRTPEEC